MILPGRFAAFAPLIFALPDGPLARTDLMQPQFRLHHEPTRAGLLEIYYAPLDVVNTEAKIVLIGIAPGFAPMRLAYRSARRDLHDGLAPEEVLARAKRAASWVGQTRTNLVAMLDALGLPSMLDAPSGWSLFNTHAHLLHSSAACRYPVFVGGGNYSGYAPAFLKTPILRHYIENVLPEELNAIGGALIVLLGRSVADAIETLLPDVLQAKGRTVLRLPHPSAGPGQAQRQQMFAARLPELHAAVAAWHRAENGIETPF